MANLRARLASSEPQLVTCTVRRGGRRCPGAALKRVCKARVSRKSIKSSQHAHLHSQYLDRTSPSDLRGSPPIIGVQCACVTSCSSVLVLVLRVRALVLPEQCSTRCPGCLMPSPCCCSEQWRLALYESYCVIRTRRVYRINCLSFSFHVIIRAAPRAVLQKHRKSLQKHRKSLQAPHRPLWKHRTTPTVLAILSVR